MQSAGWWPNTIARIFHATIRVTLGVRYYAAVNEFPDTPHRGAMWGICFLGVPKTQKYEQPGAHFMPKPPDNPR